MELLAEKLAAQPGAARPELLAPAGDWDAMRAAVANGADAVYFGLGQFNARARAANFTLEELPQAMAYLHGHNVRGYVAFNTLIFSEELEEALQFVRAIASAGVDAVIVQDLGLASLIARLCPGLAVHGSTQMTLTEPLGIEFVRRLGMQRVILARELSATDIRAIHAATDMPVQAFIHGALCVSYSGQCLTSESLGGRSANRGQCAQACRLPYELVVDGVARDLGDKAYLLSPQDLAAHDMIRELADAGVCSFKIEGRLKSAQYVAAATQAYRSAIDAMEHAKPFVLSRQQELDLAQSFSRGFTHGFLDGVNHQRLVHARFPKSRGVRIGRVAAITPRGVIVDMASSAGAAGASSFAVGGELVVGDGIVFDEGHPEQDEQGGRVASVTPVFEPRPSAGPLGKKRFQNPDAGSEPCRRSGLNSEESGSSAYLRTGVGGVSRSYQATSKPPSLPAVAKVEITFERGSVNLGAVAIGATVWKTDDPAVRRRLAASYARDLVVRRVPLTAQVQAVVGRKLCVCLADDAGHSATVQWDQPLEMARKFPLTEALFREQFGRMGDTPFELAHIRGLENPSQAMVPKSVLNDLRRQATAMILQQRTSAPAIATSQADLLTDLRRDIQARFGSTAVPATPSLHVLVRTLEQCQAALQWRSPVDGAAAASVCCDFEDVRKYKTAVAMARSASARIGLATVRVIKPPEQGLLRQVADCEPDFVLVRNLAGLVFYKREAPGLPIIADYAMNIANEATAALIAGQGVMRMTPSYDLSWKQLSALLRQFPAALFEQVVHQHMPMFHMEHCVFAHTLSSGTDYRTCGRPCEAHRVDLRDRAGAAHPLIPDVGCRNTVFNGAAQSAAEYIGAMRELGLRHFRIELLRQDAAGVGPLLNHYARVIAGAENGRAAWQQLKVLNQLGVTRGTLDD